MLRVGIYNGLKFEISVILEIFQWLLLLDSMDKVYASAIMHRVCSLEMKAHYLDMTATLPRYHFLFSLRSKSN